MGILAHSQRTWGRKSGAGSGLVAESCQTVCDPMDCSPPASSIPGISQARRLEWVTIPFSRGSSWPRDRTPCLLHWQVVCGFFTAEPSGKHLANRNLVGKLLSSLDRCRSRKTKYETFVLGADWNHILFHEVSEPSHPAGSCPHRWPERTTERMSALGRTGIEAVIPAMLTASSSRMPALGLKTSFLAFLLGSEGKSQGAAEWTHSDPVPLHAVARHGGSGVRPPSPDLREEVLGSPHAGDGPCAGALQVRRHADWEEQGLLALGTGATAGLPLLCLTQK